MTYFHTKKQKQGITRNRTQKKGRHSHKKENNAHIIYLKSRTPLRIQRLSKDITESLARAGRIDYGAPSYTPSINERLITLKTMSRESLRECNTQAAFDLKEPLKIAVRGAFFGKKCVAYNKEEAKRFLLNNLSANKHVDASVVIPPMQIHSNCWFNTMFVTLFISDKGRKFFHYFRQLMIEGKQSNGALIPGGLQDAFALLNFAIESSLTGSKYAYKMNTNSIILQIYNNIPPEYRKGGYIVTVDEASNPIRYYDSIIDYLGNYSLKILYLQDVNKEDWLSRIKNYVKKQKQVKPDIVIMEIFDGVGQKAGSSALVKNKPLSFKVEDAEYHLDSAVIRDIQQQHFCAMLTLEGKEMAYDGASFHRLVPMEWKKKINSSIKWEFEGTVNADGSMLRWSFLHGYQMLMYYRVK